MTDLVPAESRSTFLPGTNWTYPDALFVFGAGVLAAVVATVVAVGVSGGEVPGIDVQMAVLVPAQGLGTLAALWFLMTRRRLGGWTAAYGLNLRLRDWWAALVGLGLQIAFGLVLQGLSNVLSFEPPEQTVATQLAELDSLWPLVFAGVEGSVIAPLFTPRSG